MTDEMELYQNLITAIIASALEDLVFAKQKYITGLRTKYGSLNQKETLQKFEKETTDFFRGQHFYMLTDASGEVFIEFSDKLSKEPIKRRNASNKKVSKR